MRFAQNPGLFTEDEPFLVATYEVGRHWENRNLLAKEKAAIERGSGTGSQKLLEKGPQEEHEGKGKDENRQPERNSNDGQSVKPGKARLWKGLRDAFQGVPQDEIDEHKKNPNGCWRCGGGNHSRYQCYARTTAKGTTLPEAPVQIAATTTKRKREDTDQPHARLVATVAAAENTTPHWTESSDDEADF